MHDELVQWQEVYSTMIGDAFPTGDHSNRAICKALLPHVEMMLGYEVESRESQQARGRALYNGAWYAMESGQYGEAEMMGWLYVRAREAGYGSEVGLVVDAVEILGVVLRRRGKYEEAEMMIRRALAGREEVLGVDHPATLTSVNNPTSVLRDQGKYKETEALSRRALVGDYVSGPSE